MLIGYIEKITRLPITTGSISLVEIVLVFMSACIFGSAFFPPYFKFGYMKTRIFNMVIFMVMFFFPLNIVGYATKNPNNIFVEKVNYFINNTSSLMQNSLAILIGLIVLLISLLISIRIYNDKEF